MRSVNRVLVGISLAAVMAADALPALAGNSFFAPPPGMSLTTGTPTNGLALRTPRKVHLDPKYMRQIVPYTTNEVVGTIVVKTEEKFLYLVLGGGKAMRYLVAVGKEGFSWAGVARERPAPELNGWPGGRDRASAWPWSGRRCTMCARC